MTVGRKEYSEAELMRMQRDAEDRVREMHSRAREVVEHEPASQPQRNRNWNSNPNMRRPNNRRPQPQPQPEPQPEPAAQDHEEPAADHAAGDKPPEKTTIVEDVMSALKLDEDYLLIIGLLLILVNQRADTTLILALAYLLI